MARNQPALFEAHPWLRPSPTMVTLAQTAERMPTTLWFSDPSQLTTQVQAGEATCCFVLLRHLVEHRKGQYEEPGTPLHDLYTRLRTEWDAFNDAAAATDAPARAGSSGVSIWGAT